jgi:peptidoglycan/LPS O-acetylase OafA/YrhL
VGRFRPDIEGLRAVAILTVVLYHLSLFHLTGGYIGVDVFFVISGFLITGQLVKTIDENGRRALAPFYGRRIKRLLPAASATVVATIVAWRIWGLATLPRATATDAFFTTFYGINYRLAHEGTQYFNPLVSPPALQHFWSLAVEEQFYFVWPLLILIAFWHQARGGKRRNLTVALCVIGAVSLFLSWHLSGSQPTWSFYGLHTRAWELSLGALVALSVKYAERLPALAAAAMTWVGLAAIGYAAFTFTNATTYPGLAALLPVVGAALVITGGCADPSLGAGLLLNRGPAQLTGRLSYSWYLWHFPIIIVAPLAVGHVLGESARIGLLVITFAVAAASYVVVEQPFRRQQWRPSRWFALAGGSAALVAIVGLLAISFPRPAVGPGPAVATLRLSGTVSQQEGQIRDAVAAGLAARAVPNNLHPDLAHAFGDGPVIPGDCFLGVSRTTVGPCVYGDPQASRTVVMFGDSVMAQWLPALDLVGKQNHWRVVSWGKESCTINDVLVPYIRTGQPYPQCRTWRDKTIQRIRALRPQVVLVGGFLYYDDPGVPVDRWTALTLDTVRAVSAPGTTVDYLMPDALPVRDMPSCLATHLRSPSTCSIPVAAASAPADRRSALAAALDAAHVTVVDPMTLMCADGGCPAILGNVPVYRDTTHVTATYAKLLAPLFAKVLPPEPIP